MTELTVLLVVVEVVIIEELNLTGLRLRPGGRKNRSRRNFCSARNCGLLDSRQFDFQQVPTLFR